MLIADDFAAQLAIRKPDLDHQAFACKHTNKVD